MQTVTTADLEAIVEAIPWRKVSFTDIVPLLPHIQKELRFKEVTRVTSQDIREGRVFSDKFTGKLYLAETPEGQAFILAMIAHFRKRNSISKV